MFFSKKKKINEIDMSRLPQHIGIIMDGNGRWAKKRGLPRSAGHSAGADSLKKIITEANNLGVKYITVYAFSTENWKRPKEEVDYLISGRLARLMMLKMYFTTIFSRRSIIRFPFWKIFLLQRPTAKRW